LEEEDNAAFKLEEAVDKHGDAFDVSNVLPFHLVQK